MSRWMIARDSFSPFISGTLLEKIEARLIYLNETYVLRSRLFRRGSGRQDAALRPVHFAQPACEEDRREQSRGRFHSCFAWTRGSCRGRGRNRELDRRQDHRAIRSGKLVRE